MVSGTLKTFNGERRLAAEESLQRAFSFAASRKLELRWRTVGAKLKTASCDIRDSRGLTAVGRGKGLGMQSVASAVYEAIEHFFHLAEDLDQTNSTLGLNMNTLHADLHGGSPDLGLIIKSDYAPLTCTYFEKFFCSKSGISIPSILFNPKFISKSNLESEYLERSKLYRYSTNSGTASALNIEEAELHGLLELIERDALSLALVRHVLSPNPEEIRKIDRRTLPADCQILMNMIQEESGGDVAIWDITSDFGIPVIMCALTTRGIARHRFFGMGASMCREYALERAALEALQGHHIHTGFGVRLQPPIVDRDLARLSLYQRCELRFGYFDHRGGEVRVEWDQVPTVPGSFGGNDINEQTVEIVRRLAERGCNTYRRVILQDDVCVTQVAAPRLERLFLISEGLPVGPGARARDARRKMQSRDDGLKVL
jgi:ribosomal protein S12 methylthiotransferase accessory factor